MSAVGSLRVVSSGQRGSVLLLYVEMHPLRPEEMRFCEIIKFWLIFADVVMDVLQFLIEFRPKVEVLPVCLIQSSFLGGPL